MKIGTALPNVTFKTRVRDEAVGGENPYRWSDQTSQDLFSEKRVLLIGLPGAFTPTCSNRQLPAFDELAETFKEQGIDAIYCVSVNDAFVMKQWADRCVAARQTSRSPHMLNRATIELTVCGTKCAFAAM